MKNLWIYSIVLLSIVGAALVGAVETEQVSDGDGDYETQQTDSKESPVQFAVSGEMLEGSEPTPITSDEFSFFSELKFTDMDCYEQCLMSMPVSEFEDDAVLCEKAFAAAGTFFGSGSGHPAIGGAIGTFLGGTAGELFCSEGEKRDYCRDQCRLQAGDSDDDEPCSDGICYPGWGWDDCGAQSYTGSCRIDGVDGVCCSWG